MLFRSIYESRINDKELKAAILELLPGIDLYGGADNSSNDLLFNNDWVSVGARVTWNLIRFLQLPQRKLLILAQDNLLKTRGKAIALAIMTQVHVARVRFFHAKKEFQTAREYLSVQRKLLEKTRIAAEGSRASRQTLTREEMNTLVAEVKFDLAYSALQTAYANIFASIGMDTFSSSEHANLSLEELSGKIKRIWKDRESGRGTSQFTHVYKVVPENRPVGYI